MPLGKFTIRVYGLLINDRKEVLVTDEIFQGQRMTKFPGGGLEQGEGTIDCLKREMFEELGQPVDVGEHFYTTDFYQLSIFQKDVQLICIYYFITTPDYSFDVRQTRFDFPADAHGTVVFRWVSLEKINSEPFSFENDRKVAGMLATRFLK